MCGSVDQDPAREQSSCDLPCMRRAAREHVVLQAIVRVVGDRDGLVFVPVSQQAQDRAEDLLAGDTHVVAYVGEDRRFHEIPLVERIGPAFAPGDDAGTLSYAGTDPALHGSQCGLVAIGPSTTDGSVGFPTRRLSTSDRTSRSTSASRPCGTRMRLPATQA